MMCRFEIDDSSVVEWRWYVDDLNRIPEVVSDWYLKKEDVMR